MYKLIAILLLLAGCSPGERVMVERARENGRTTFDSRVTLTELSARFECRASDSGQCHYALFAQDCAAGPCADPPLRQFALDAGAERTMSDLPHGVRVCVRREPGAMTAACLHPQRAAGSAPG